MTTLKQIQQNQLQKEVVINDNFSTVAPAGIFGFKGNLNGLLYNYYGGIYVDSNGKPLEIADGSVTLGNNAKNYICFNPTTSKVEVSQLALADGVVPIAEVTVTNSVITAIKDTRMHKYLQLGQSGGGGYVLPIASDKTLGGIKVGKNLTINPDGTLDASGGGGGGLTYLSETYTTTTPFSTTFPCISLIPSALAAGEDTASANVSISITPIGLGAFTLQTPTSNVTGGNQRGTKAVDLQLGRSTATQVASGQYSFCAGYNNSATVQSAVALGESNQATGSKSFCAGYNNTASGPSSVALGSNNKALGTSSFSAGESTQASDFSVAIGSNCWATGSYSASFGFTNKVIGSYSFAVGMNNTNNGQTCSILSGEYNTFDSYGKKSAIIGGSYVSNKTSMCGYYFGPAVRSGQGSNQQSKYILSRFIDVPGTYPEWNLNFDNATSSASNQIPVTPYETKFIKGNVLVTDYNTTAGNIDGATASFDVEFCVQQMGSKATTQLIGTPKITKAFSNTNGDSRGWDIRIDCDTTNGVVQVMLKNPNFKNFKACAVLDSTDIIMNNN